MASIFLYFLGFLILHVFTKHFLNKIRNLPPSPFPCLPVIGHLHLLTKKFFQTSAQMAAQYGPIIFLQLGNRPTIVVSSSSIAEECLSKNDIVFANRPRYIVAELMANNCTNMIWSPYGDHWRNLRRIASTEILSTSRLQMMSEIRTDEIKALMVKLLQFQDKSVDLRTMLFELTFNVMTRMIAGKPYYGDDVADVEEAMRFREGQIEAQNIVSAPNLGDFLPWLRSKKLEKRMVECRKNREIFLQDLLEQGRKKLKSGGGEERKKTLIEVFLSRQESEPEYYTDEMIGSMMQALLTAGTETSITTMEWAFSLLLNNPQTLKIAQTEIENTVGYNRLINESDISNLPYLRGIITETLRMYPTVPMLLPHESSKECTVGGYRVPAGALLLVNVWAIQNDPKVWADPRKFRPERFEEMEGIGKDGFKLMPFGSGRRACPGEGLALRVMGLTLGSLIQCFEWGRIGDEMVDMTEGTGLALHKTLPLLAKCRPRAAAAKLIS